MGKCRKSLRSGDLVLIRTPEFHTKSLDSVLEGKTGVIMRVVEVELPIESKTSARRSYEVFVEGNTVVFYNDRYMTRIVSQ